MGTSDTGRVRSRVPPQIREEDASEEATVWILGVKQTAIMCRMMPLL